MARPLWLRLFGPNGPTSISELRDALLNAPFGQGAGDGNVTSRLFELIGRTPVSIERPGPGVDGTGQDQILREQVNLASAARADQVAVAFVTPSPETSSGTRADEPQSAPIDQSGSRSISLYVNSIVSPPGTMSAPRSPFATTDPSIPYVMFGDPQTGLVIDTRNKTLMQGGPGDYPELFAGPNDMIELDGDYSAGFTIDVPDYVEQIVARAGSDYNLITEDAGVAAGHTLTINAMGLGRGNHMIFDGSAETDGRFLFYGSERGDVFFGGAGNDVIYGLGGADVLSGGLGRDTFVYYGAGQSTGPDYDILADFNPLEDRIDLEVTVSGFDAAISTGTLSTASFDADLGAALAGLGAGKAVLYSASEGDLAGNVFLIVDANGVAGYQAGEDYVFALTGATLEDLSGQTGFFI